MERLADWLARHEDLEARWDVLWVAAPEVDDAGWAEGVADLRRALRLHMDQEEAWLLPAWEEVADAPPNATAAVLRRDHALLRGHLDALAAAPDRVARLSAAFLLREVLHHHDAREAASIKPGLDRLLPADTVRAWLARFLAEEAALPPAWTFTPHVRGVSDGPTPEHALAADAPVAERVAQIPVPDHPKGPRLHARALAAARVVDAEPDPARRRRLAVDVWAALRLLRLTAGG